MFGAAPRVTVAQTVNQLAAWDGLMLSPIGALAPVAHDPAYAGKPGDVLSLRHGRWRYDADDAVHDTFALTWAHRFAFARTEVAVTGGYALVECGTCSGWQMAGLSLHSTVFQRVAAYDRMNAFRSGVGIRLDVGGAHFHGEDRSSTISASVTMPMEVTLPLPWTSSLGLAVVPGLGYGSISSSGLTENGIVPMLGGAIAWAITSRVVLDVGAQRVIIPNGTTQVGAAISWTIRSRDAAKR